MVEGPRPTALRVALIGVGGTGCALLPLLATLPLARITLVDGDTVEAANLSRQPLYGPADVGRLKVSAAAAALRRTAPDMDVVEHPYFLDAANAHALLGQHDIVADCTDDLHARTLIDTVCAELHHPLVSGAVHGTQVQVVTLHARPGLSLRSFFPARSAAEQDGCDMRQVPASVTTFAAAVMAEHVAALVHGDTTRAGTLELIDTRTGKWLRILPPTAARPHAPSEHLLSTQA